MYAAALVMAVLCLLSMSLVHEVERKLPGRAVFDVSLSFCRDTAPELEQLAQVALTHGYRFVHELSRSDEVVRFSIVPLKN